MSQEEQDAALGKLVRERVEAKRDLDQIRQQLKANADSLFGWSEVVRASVQDGYAPKSTVTGEIPTQDALENLIARKRPAFERLSRIESTLRSAGSAASDVVDEL